MHYALIHTSKISLNILKIINNFMEILKRFTYSYFYNIVSLFFTFLSGIYLAKSFGPDVYGTYAYLVAIFGGIFYMLDLGSSNAFFTFSSKQKKNFSFYKNYGFFLIGILALVTSFFLFVPEYFFEYLNIDVKRKMLMVAIPAIFFRNHLWNIIKKIYESNRLSISVNLVNMIISIIYYLIILSLDIFYELTLSIIFLVIFIEFFIFSICIFIAVPIDISNDIKSSNSLYSYYKYCLPIAPMLFFGGFVKVLEAWLINFFGGSEQQAYFAISLQFTMILVLALSSIIHIFWKEIAKNIEDENLDAAAFLYLRSAKYLLFFMTIGSFFLFFQAENIINIFLNEDYSDALIPMQILFLYPCFQVFGQLNNVMFLANESTMTYSKYGFLHMLASILISIIGLYFISNYNYSFISVASFMALKIILVDFLIVIATTKQIKIMFNLYRGLNFMYLVPVASCFYAYIIFCITGFATPENMPFLNLILNGIIYCIFLIFLFFKIPSALFISKEDSLFLRKKLKL